MRRGTLTPINSIQSLHRIKPCQVRSLLKGLGELDDEEEAGAAGGGNKKKDKREGMEAARRALKVRT